MNHISIIHEKVLDHFIKIRKDNPDFYFVPRKINNKGRLDGSYWFIGNEEYLHISFWNGMDWKEKIHNIGFVIHDDKQSNVELSAQDSAQKASFLNKVASQLKGYVKVRGEKNKWHKQFEGKDYLGSLDQFIREDKPVIDALLSKEQPDGITFLDKRFDKRYVQRVLDLRDRQIEFGSTNKITRVTWNRYRWQRPSGSEGKSEYKGAYEAISGFGNEEWLMDKTAVIDGFHYGFIQSLNLETYKHVGNIYNITLFTVNNLGKKYEVGTLNKVQCISKEQSDEIYREYKVRGWLDKMINDLKRENADFSKLVQTSPDQFFNVRFKFEDAVMNEELPEISDDDVNITTSHFRLLPKKTIELSFKPLLEISSDDGKRKNDRNGNKKNTDKRKKVFNVECEYDPYHDQMQNALYDLLDRGYEGYHGVMIEHGWVDLKALNKKGDWHFFEIKTDGPRLSIRKALGQVMEYAYYPSQNKAQKLIIIADELPDAESIEYLNHIRKKFNLPVYFRAFDKNTGMLSSEF